MASGEPADSALDQRIPAAPGGLFQADIDLGAEAREDRVSLEVRAHDADEVWVVADVSGPGASSVAFRLEHDPAGVRLYARSRGILAWLFGGPSVQIRVFVPRQFALDLRAASGPIRVGEVSGEIRARTRDARLEVRAVDGPLRLRSRTGAIAVSEVAGDVEVRAQDAPIELAWVHGKVDARTGSGDIERAISMATSSCAPTRARSSSATCAVPCTPRPSRARSTRASSPSPGDLETRAARSR
jgi:hypothetical protein